MERLMKGSVLIAAIGLGVSSVVLADDEKANGVRNCTVATLDGLYVFAASGFIIPASGPAQPKAILEWIRFNGDGTVFVAERRAAERCRRTNTGWGRRQLHRHRPCPTGWRMRGHPHLRPFNVRPIHSVEG